MKIWGSSAPSGQILPISDTNFAAGFYYLGNNPPTAEEFNWLFQQLTQGIVTAGRFWQASTAYEVGHVLYSSDFTQSFKVFECTIAGTSGSTEPTWSIVGNTVTDGTATWVVKRIGNNVPYNEQIYSTAGTYTFTAPVSGKYKVTVIGGGGGAGGAKSNSGSIYGLSSGGCAGGTSIKTISLTAGDIVSVTVGAGGAGGVGTTPADGTAGGTSSFGAYCSATGGPSSQAANATSITILSTVNGIPGIGSNGDLNIRGGSGLIGTNFVGQIGGGCGGASFLSGSINGRSTVNVAGYSGLLGGGGGGVSALNSNCNGGAGGDGAVIIER